VSEFESESECVYEFESESECVMLPSSVALAWVGLGTTDVLD